MIKELSTLFLTNHKPSAYVIAKVNLTFYSSVNSFEYGRETRDL